MYFLINDLSRKLKSEGSVVIAGERTLLNMIYPLLKEAGLKNKIQGFLFVEGDKKTEREAVSKVIGIKIKMFLFQTFKIGSETIDGIPTISIDQKNFLDVLQRQHSKEILKISDFIVTQDELENLTDERFLSTIVESEIV